MARLKVSPQALAKRLFLRTALRRSAGAGAALLLAGCDRLSGSPTFNRVLSLGESLSSGVRNAVGLSAQTMAQEFSPADLSPSFRGNGNINPQNAAYQALVASGFADWKLVVDGLVEAPASLSLAQLRAMPGRTQITRHDCVEGWSAIGQWTGVPLALVLAQVRPKPAARYVVFHCADTFGADDEGDDSDDSDDGDGTAPATTTTAKPAPPASSGTPYYESIDLQDAHHPQTLLAYALNGQPLPVTNGAPLRLRVERQLGYKHAKYLMRLELVADFAHIGQGHGGYWEDQGYQWYAGI